MIGYTNSEGIIVDLLNRFIYNKSMPIDLIKFKTKEINWNESDLNQFYVKIKEFYFNGNEPNVKDMEDYIKLMTDAWFMVGIREAAKYQLERSNGPIYFYKFSMDSKLNFVKNMNSETAKYFGASHGDEIGYLFTRGKEIKMKSVEDVNVKRLIKIWTTFAKTGNPNVNNESLIDVEWKPLVTNEFNYAELGNTLSVNVDPDGERYDFWCKIKNV